jgi:hypothetical protein
MEQFEWHETVLQEGLSLNLAYCGACGKLAPAAPVERDNRIFLVKKCPACGPTESLISGDAARYNAKRSLDLGHDYQGCALDCKHCRRGKQPNMVFLDVTNRCNLNCPICINNTPSMGFLFEPPMEYFDHIFKHFSQDDPKPAVQLFGGEPTVRKDLFEIIQLSRSYGLPTRVVTNGIKLADEEYCRKLIESRATILIAYDNDNPKTYSVLRGSEKALGLKLQALANIRRIGGAKVALMSLVAKGFNDQDLPRLFEFCHEAREQVRGIYFMPMAHNWTPDRLDLETERITSEEVEGLVARIWPEESVDFIPAGFFGQLRVLSKYLHLKPMPFAGAHPNCESMYLLVSDGARYVPLNRYLRAGAVTLGRDLLDAERRMAAREEALQKGAFGRTLAALRLRTAWLWSSAAIAMGRVFLRHVRVGRILKGRGPVKLWHAAMAPLKLLFGGRSRIVLGRHTNVQRSLQLIVLPFEDRSTLETDRLERCPAGFAYVDPKDGKVRTVSTCAWGIHKTAIMREIMAAYKAAEPALPVAPSDSR